MRIRQRGIGQIISQKEERHAWLSAQAGQEASSIILGNDITDTNIPDEKADVIRLVILLFNPRPAGGGAETAPPPLRFLA